MVAERGFPDVTIISPDRFIGQEFRRGAKTEFAQEEFAARRTILGRARGADVWTVFPPVRDGLIVAQRFIAGARPLLTSVPEGRLNGCTAMFSRPSGTGKPLSQFPSDKSLGYCHKSLWDNLKSVQTSTREANCRTSRRVRSRAVRFSDAPI